MSADGSVLIGNTTISTPGVFMLSREDGAFRRLGDIRENLGFLPDPSWFKHTQACGISSDGQVVVGSSGDWTLSMSGSQNLGPQAFRWTAAAGMQALFTPRLPMSVAMAASADGSTIVGYYDLKDSRRRAYRWTANGVTQLEPLLGDSMAEAFAVSGDGSVVVGESGSPGGYHACLWTNGSYATSLGYLFGLSHTSEARAVSADGKVIVGAIGNRQAKQLAFRWTASTGIQALGDISPSAATAVSADGSVIVGDSNGEAFRWDAEHGKQPLAALLTAAGIDLGDLHLDSAIALSADGSTILGTGSYPLGVVLAFDITTPRTVVWLAHLPVVPEVPEVDVPSAYLPAPPFTTSSLAPPVIGKPKIALRNSRLFARAVARGAVTKVSYRVGDNGSFKTAVGTNSWRFTARLAPGRNSVSIIAQGPGGDSAPAKLIVTRP
jgi:probable HAF family extracellular repeat protein